VADIQKLLASHGVIGKNGKALTASGITYILTNETYVGDKLLQKRAPKNMLTKQPEKRRMQKTTKERTYDSNYLVNDHAGIISRAVWEATQRKLQMRKAEIAEIAEIEKLQKTALSSAVATQSEAIMADGTAVSAIETVTGTAGRTGSSPMASYGSKTPLFGKIICGDCGSLMKRKTYKDAKKGANGGNYKVWSCKTPKRAQAESLDIHSDYSDYDDYDKERVYCSTKSIKETEIIAEILRQAEARGLMAAGETASKTAKLAAKSDEPGKLPRAVEQLLPRIKRIIIGGQGGNINIEWN
ncbi:MAG: recombinase family protein, partial [Synergistaceae bacterium]|nr:recombinase family protein [Synergistaceae bacterium]